MYAVNISAKFELRSFTRSWYNRGYCKNLGSPWVCPHTLFSQTFNGLLFAIRMDAVNISVKFEVLSFTRSWDNREYWKNLGRPWIRPRSLFSQIFNRLLLGWTLWIYLPNLKFFALHVPEIIGVLDKLRDDVTSDVKKPGSTIRVDRLDALCSRRLCHNMVEFGQELSKI